MGHPLSENRNGIVVRVTTMQAGYYEENIAALEMIDALGTVNKKTLCAGKHYDNDNFIDELRSRNVSLHLTRTIHLWKHFSVVNGITTRHLVMK
jgi:hypothetical protein